MRVVFMGTPEFAVPSLEHLILNQYQLVAVYTQPDKRAGRGQTLIFSPLKKTALAWKLPVMQPARLKSIEVVAELAALQPDIIVVAAFGQILPPAVLDIPKYGCINIHPSLLPRFRGASPVASAIMAGEEFTGVSIMLMDKGLDTGPVLTRAQIPVLAADTTGVLTDKLSLLAAQLIQEVIPRWVRGEITPQPQSQAEATYSTTISKAEGKIDWYLPAVALWRRVRACQPWPGSYTQWKGKQLKIIEAAPLFVETAADAGTVVSLIQDKKAKAAFGVVTGDGILAVHKVQLEGKQSMSATDFLRGQRQFVGEILPVD
ncbi:MAG: methionyl-tRNA formyltransferase [Dehalococcoidales bacterium]|nr:methionyl-tRNA formyltransferase [Dehalococcoidales bacterium]